MVGAKDEERKVWVWGECEIVLQENHQLVTEQVGEGMTRSLPEDRIFFFRRY